MAEKATTKTTCVVQPFEEKRNQELTPGRPITARDEFDAVERAKVLGERLKGVAALRFVSDRVTGELMEAAVLSQHGAVPEDLAERIGGW